MIRRLSLMAGALVVAVAMAVPAATAGTSGHSGRSAAGDRYWRQHGYLVPNPAQYARLKAQAAARAGQKVTPQVYSPNAPVVGPSFQGVFESDLAPPDPTGAIGPNSYVEAINLQLALYNRTGGLMSTVPMEGLFGGVHFNYSDPQALWDPNTNRFYLLIWDTTNATMRWAFSKTSNPATVTPVDWCVYTSSFGYSPNDAPDYPKLGQTKDFLLIGVDFFQNFASFLGGELLTIQKPQGSAPVATCPGNTFGTNRFTSLRMIGAQRSGSPEPAQQADPSGTGYVVAAPRVGSSTLIGVWTVTNSGGTPVVTGPTTVTVPSYSTPADPQQCNTSTTLDSLDGRLEHAVSARDPANGNKIQVWTAHAVFGGAGSEERWYEIDPSVPSVTQSGSATSGSLYVFNGGIAPDRTVHTTAAHGQNMVMGFSTSSSTQCPALQAVSKLAGQPQSGFVMVHQGTDPDNDFTCSPCRWGDYSGASPDPGVGITDATGKVWIANEYLSGPNPGGNPNWRTWIAGITP